MIAEQTLTVRLPASVVAKLRRAAALTYRTVDDIVATTVDAALVEPPSAPADVAADFAAMHLLSDQALFAAAQPSLSPAKLSRLRQLNRAAGERALAEAEMAEQTAQVGGKGALARAPEGALKSQADKLGVARAKVTSALTEPQAITASERRRAICFASRPGSAGGRPWVALYSPTAWVHLKRSASKWMRAASILSMLSRSF